ncbi:MAG: quinone-dependent dihydroorotate dehydrogenase [Anaerolineales bacterium]|jgi:dihydroorotate dehydrogenase
MKIYPIFRALLFRLDPEQAHRLTLACLRLAGQLPPIRSFMRRIFVLPTPGLERSVAGLDFSNPIGLAAGYDKDGTATVGLSCLGFGHLELGTVTPKPQSGNPRPRIFRLPQDQGLINSMGFPNQGGLQLVRRLQKGKPKDVLIGVNIGKGAATPIEEAAEDYLMLWHLVAPRADYIAVNVSSPNTVGLRRLQARDLLEGLLGQLTAGRRTSGPDRPIFVKLAPDLTAEEMSDAVSAAIGAGIDGLIATNTTISRPALRSGNHQQQGGLSGYPLKVISLAFVRRLVQQVDGRLPVIGVGGIDDGPSAKAMLAVGADLIQVYTGLVYQGPFLVRSMLSYLSSHQDEM